MFVLFLNLFLKGEHGGRREEVRLKTQYIPTNVFKKLFKRLLKSYCLKTLLNQTVTSYTTQFKNILNNTDAYNFAFVA